MHIASESRRVVSTRLTRGVEGFSIHLSRDDEILSYQTERKYLSPTYAKNIIAIVMP
jgi:hypothetical protein